MPNNSRSAKILATLGPATSEINVIDKLLDAGANAFRLNFSHGSHEDHARTHALVRSLEALRREPVSILADLQGPKLRIGKIAGDVARLLEGAKFVLDMDQTPGDAQRASLMHPEIFEALTEGSDLLIDDGRIRLRVQKFDQKHAVTEVITGGQLSSNKGVNVPGLILPISPLTEKDLRDLDFALSLGVEWVAMSFVQRPEDIHELRHRVKGRALCMAKIEKPSAVKYIKEITELSDAVMVARGDLGVEIPQESVPVVQRRIIRVAREAGRPVVVATQMLESMIQSPIPTRAESSDVATATYEGADAVMLSAETATGRYPVEAVTAMSRILSEVEKDPSYREGINAASPESHGSAADAICSSLKNVASVLPLAATVTYTESGFSALRVARERPGVPIIGITPYQSIARRLALVWGVHPMLSESAESVDAMVDNAIRVTLSEGLGKIGAFIAVTAGLPLGRSGTTNMMRVTRLKSLTKGISKQVIDDACTPKQKRLVSGQMQIGPLALGHFGL
ncbi:MAG: pyruvate kinase [Burkholderiaceae bacterium]